MPDTETININLQILNALVEQTGKVAELGTKMDSQKETNDRLADSIDRLTGQLSQNGGKRATEAVGALEVHCATARAEMKDLVEKATAGSAGKAKVSPLVYALIGLCFLSVSSLIVLAGAETDAVAKLLGAVGIGGGVSP